MNPKDLVQFIEEKKLAGRHEYILLAVSGGIDSVVMAHLFHQAKFRFAIAHCNFCLRNLESDEDEVFVRNLAQTFDVPFFSEKFDTKSFAAQNGFSVQMAARKLRYDWFEKIRKENGFDYIATAHHLDDQVETFLINLVRGTGIAGLHGIPVKNGYIIRPMLFAFRKDIAQYAAEGNVGYREDRSNQETKYLRNKIRHDVIPMLCSINPDFVDGLSDTIRRLRDFEQLGIGALEEWQKHAISKEGNSQVIKIAGLKNNSLAPVLAWEFLSQYGFNETQLHNMLSSFGNENRKVFLSPTHRLVKERGRLIVSAIEPESSDKIYKIAPFARKKNLKSPLLLRFEHIKNPDNYEIPATGRIASLDAGKLKYPLVLRKWRNGDTFCPLGMKKKKKISDFLINEKVSLHEKEHIWLLCSGEDIVWIIGYRIDHRYRITNMTKEIIMIVNSEQ
jgi:tRNA(Ile)-lysidine synthase